MSGLLTLGCGAKEMVYNNNATIKKIGLGQGSQTTTTHLRLFRVGKRGGIYLVNLDLYRRVSDNGHVIDKSREILDPRRETTVLDWWKNLGLERYLEPKGELRIYFDGRSMRLSRLMNEEFWQLCYRDNMTVTVGKAFHPRTATVRVGGLSIHKEPRHFKTGLEIFYKHTPFLMSDVLDVGESVTITPLPSKGNKDNFTYFKLTAYRPTGPVEHNPAGGIHIDRLHHYVSEKITF